MTMYKWDLTESPNPLIYKHKRCIYDDTIYTFDIETVSLFNINNEWQTFDYSKDGDYYRDNKIDKIAVPYIWQFGINDTVYYGRELYDFENVLTTLSDPLITKFIFVHNLSYEFVFIQDIIEKNGWHITNMCARNLRQPIQFKIEELNIYFRCSYMLTNLSLEKSAEKYTNLQKAVGELDYNKGNFSPLCSLTNEELHYCEMDIITLYHIIKYFRDSANGYGHIKSIPLTQTGEVRYSLREAVDYYYIKKQWSLVPSEHMYCALMSAFQGGITHANALYTNQIKHNVWSYDFASSYPYCLTFPMPSEPFHIIRENQIERLKDTHTLLYHIRIKNARSKLYNHFLSRSKLDKLVIGSSGCVDNGRMIKFEYAEMICTQFDLEMITSSYECTIEYVHIWASFNRYLDKRVLMFILERYKAKTELKNDESQADFYMKMKQQLNSVFGMAVTNQLKAGIYYDNGEWFSHNFDDIITTKDGQKMRFIDSKLLDMKKSYSTLFFYAVGVVTTARARYNLWRNIQQLDTEVIYYDTDSIKGTGERVKQVIENYNNEVIEHLKKCASDNNIDIDYFMPKDDKGNTRPLGLFECETKTNKLGKHGYIDFVTMGAKKYCYRDEKGQLHMTVSGVRKDAVLGLHNDIMNFKKGTVFDYEVSKKLTHCYVDNQTQATYTDIDGNEYTSHQIHGIVLQPTTYKLGITDDYEEIVNQYFGIIPDNI